MTLFVWPVSSGYAISVELVGLKSFENSFCQTWIGLFKAILFRNNVTFILILNPTCFGNLFNLNMSHRV